MSFAVINLCVASQRVFTFVVVVVHFVIDSVRKLLDTSSYKLLKLLMKSDSINTPQRSAAYGLAW
jgi:hypothetical protein